MTFADISKAREKLGYNPQVKFEQGIKLFAEWFRENAESRNCGSRKNLRYQLFFTGGALVLFSLLNAERSSQWRFNPWIKSSESLTDFGNAAEHVRVGLHLRVEIAGDVGEIFQRQAMRR